ncbi:MAG: DUF4870 domain-containing protein [Planctomycetota bacterium]|jgi:uncharacterized Tic20 family protein
MSAAFEEPDADAATRIEPPAAVVDPRDQQYAMLLHLTGFLGYLIGPVAIAVPLAMWLGRKEDSPFLDDHGREAVNYNISIWIYAFIASMLMLVGIGCLLLPAVIIFDIIVVIIAAVRASGGEFYRYPMTIRFIV